MECHIPALEKCCFFFPLRPGLLVYGYFKLISAIFIEILFTYLLVTSHARDSLIGFIIAITLIDAGTTIIFIIGCHKKNILCITWFYTYSIYLLSFKAIILIILSLFHPIPWESLPNMIIHFYLLLLIKSEIIKLNKQNVAPSEFVNKMANPDCTINIPVKSQSTPGKGIQNINAKNNGMDNNLHKGNEPKYSNIVTNPTHFE